MSDNLTRRGRVWHYDFTHGGKRHRGSTRQSDKALARAVVNQLKSRADRVAVYGPEHELTFAEAASLYLTKNRNDVKLVEKLVAEIGTRRVATLLPAEFTDLAIRLYPKGKPSTRNRTVIAPASAIINNAAARGLAHPVRLKLFAVEIAPKAAGSKPWLKAFQAAAQGRGLLGLAALARFMFETGARVSQATELRWSDVNLAEGRALLKTRKTGANGPEFKYREPDLTPAMVAELANLPRHPSGRVFGYASRSTVKNAWSRVIKAAGLPKLSRHEAGRHGFFTETIVRNGMNVVDASAMGGITPALALKRYAHAEEKRAKLLKVFG